eukprot:13129367-Alexandrium_andersonii.AAC.1
MPTPTKAGGKASAHSQASAASASTPAGGSSYEGPERPSMCCESSSPSLVCKCCEGRGSSS